MNTENESEIVLKSFGFDGINDDEMRKFECWGSVEVVDRHQEVIPAEEVYKIMDIWMDRGAPIMFNHSNRQVGKGLNWRPAEKNGAKGVLITGSIFKHYKEDDDVWTGIKEGLFEGLSIGGKSFLREKDEDGHTTLRNLIGYEFSVVGRTGNQEATFTEVNTMAKSEKVMKQDEPVMDENPDTGKEDELSQLKNMVTALIEKVAMIEEKISGKPAEETPVEEQKAEPEPEKEEEEAVEPEKKPEDEVEKMKAEVSNLKAELTDLKKSIVTKTISTERPGETPKEDKYTEVRKSLKEMSEKGKISFQELGKQMRE
jgi:hypothetical protein